MRQLQQLPIPTEKFWIAIKIAKLFPGKHGTHSLHARTLHSGSQLKIEGSPYANHFGQNVFTSFDMPKAVTMAINVVTEDLDFNVLTNRNRDG